MKYSGIVLIVAFICALAMHSYAEGTREIRPSSSNHGYVQIWDNGDPNRIFATYDADSFSRLYINIKDPLNERIFFGFGSKLHGPANVYYRLRDPNGNIVMGPTLLPSSGSGYISNYTNAITGPSQLTSTGYTAISHNPSMAGNYYLEFNPSDPTIVNRTKCVWREFDITVGHIPTSTAINGRVYSMNWDFTTNGSTNRFYGPSYIYTNDSIVTQLDPNGYMPFGFTITCNRSGTGNSGDFAQDRKSITTFSYNPEFKIFLNDPDTTVYPTGSAAKISANSANTITCDSVYCIDIEFSKQGQAQVIIDLNGTPGYQSGTSDVRILNYVSGGQVCFTWTGYDGLGNRVEPGTPVTITVIIVSGLTNFPIWDAECNPDGFIVNSVRPSLPAPRLYYDDTDLGGTDNTSVGCVAPCHNWGNTSCSSPVGNNVMVNTYWFATINTQTFVTILPSCPPIANNDYGVTTELVPVVIPVLDNDEDPNNDLDTSSVNVTVPLAPLNGSITNIDPNSGEITYTPAPGFTGVDSFRYLVCDDFLGCDTATVFITINCAPPTAGIDISGYVFYDYYPSDQIYNSTDIGIAGAEVNIYRDVNKNGIRDGGDVYLDTRVTDANGYFSYIPKDNKVVITRRINESNDDAEEDFSGTDQGYVTRNSSDLDIGEGYTSGGSSTVVGLKFDNINLPQGTVIDSASITFKARSTESGNCTFWIFCEDENDASSYGWWDFALSSRNYTSSYVTWSNVPTWFDNNYYTTPNLKSIVQQILDRPGWSAGNDMAFGIIGNDRREADSYNGSPSNAPLLYLSYDTFNVYYVMEVDTNSVPQPQYDLTTDNVELSFFYSAPSADCSNNFGFFNRSGFWPLASEILYFDAKLHKENIVELSWTVSTELNTSAYKIERSIDGKNFVPFDDIKITDNHPDDVSYQIFDENPSLDHNYYRIVKLDHQDNKVYSEIRSVFISPDGNGTKVYPNSLKHGDFVHIYFEKALETSVEIDIHDLRGSLIHSYTFDAGMDHIFFKVDISNPGIYLLSIHNEEMKTVEKLLMR